MSYPIETTVTPAHGWTPDRKVRFLDQLAVHGNARAACRAVGLSAEAAYKLRRREPLFARAWAAAVVLGRDNSVQVLSERAIEGVEEEIYYRGELIGTRRRYDSRLLLAHLARLDRLADEENAGADAGRFDELLATIAEDTGAELSPARADHVADAAALAARAQQLIELDLMPELASADDDEFWSERNEEPDLTEAEEVAKLRRTMEAICDEAGAQAKVEAGKVWDRRRAAAIATVDAVTNATAATLADGSASLLPGLASLVVARPADLRFARPNRGALSFPCTLSTASTAALASTLAEPPGWAMTPRSPFSAPRRING